MSITEKLYQAIEENKKVEPTCDLIYETLMDKLEAAERKQLIALSDEYTRLNSAVHEKGFKEGFAAAVKMIFEAVLAN